MFGYIFEMQSKKLSNIKINNNNEYFINFTATMKFRVFFFSVMLVPVDIVTFTYCIFFSSLKINLFVCKHCVSKVFFFSVV